MEKEFIPYNEALALKELGFDEPCFVYVYLGDTGNNVNHTLEVLPSLVKNHNQDSLCISKPTFSQAFRWFREKYGFIYEVNVYSTSDGYSYSFKILCKKYTPYIEANNSWLTYEEAELECLKKLIEIVKNRSNE